MHALTLTRSPCSSLSVLATFYCFLSLTELFSSSSYYYTSTTTHKRFIRLIVYRHHVQTEHNHTEHTTTNIIFIHISQLATHSQNMPNTFVPYIRCISLHCLHIRQFIKIHTLMLFFVPFFFLLLSILLLIRCLISARLYSIYVILSLSGDYSLKMKKKICRVFFFLFLCRSSICAIALFSAISTVFSRFRYIITSSLQYFFVIYLLLSYFNRFIYFFVFVISK